MRVLKCVAYNHMPVDTTVLKCVGDRCRGIQTSYAMLQTLHNRPAMYRFTRVSIEESTELWLSAKWTGEPLKSNK